MLIVCRIAALTVMASGFSIHSFIAAASIVGTNPPAESITRQRIEKLPLAERHLWIAYLARSEEQRNRDQAFVRAELHSAGMATPLEPSHSNAARTIPLDRGPAWYASEEARHIADVVVSFQTPAGGWGKNIDMSKKKRRPGESFSGNNLSRYLSPGDFDAPSDPAWNYVGTIDNDATTTQINFLAKVVSAGNRRTTVSYRTAFIRGMSYLFAAQFPNGGWPQVWPLEGGYHDAITYNDDAMTAVLRLMRQVSEGRGDFSFVPAYLRQRAQSSFARGIACVMRTQIVVNGTPTVWPQQDDALTLQPVSARNFEPPAQCAQESASLLLMLMDDLPHPDDAQKLAIRAAVEWLRRSAIHERAWKRTPGGRNLVPDPHAAPIWARYYQIGGNFPIFADRDKSIHDSVDELSAERRNGYSWFGSEPLRALERYETWNRANTEKK